MPRPTLRPHHLIAALLLTVACSSPHDIVILHGRVMDPETGLDAPRNVGIRDGTIASVTEDELAGRDTLDATGLVVAPGFIDLHAHGQDSVSERLQALDGVTTALEMEIGVYPVASWYASREGRTLLNFGATVSHPNARTKLLLGIDVGHQPTLPPGENESMGSDVIYQELDDAQVAELAALMELGLAEGGLGYGFGITYTPGASREEILDLFASAEAHGVPAYVHLRAADEGGNLGPFQEVIANAAATGASLHIVHLNSSADESAMDAVALVRGAAERGLDVTTEAYPYTASSTFIESALFDPWVGLDDEAYQRLQWPGQEERLNARTFAEYREQGGWVVIHGRNEETNEWIVAQPDVIAASDGIPFLHLAVHPRGAGTFARILGHYSRDRGVISLMDALAKMTILPARRVEGAAPAMARKGRVQVGADADLALLDPETVLDMADYDAPATPSRGFMHVLVGGTPVVRDGSLVEGVFPGRAIRRERATAM
ncbi:MAG: amidohydrolase family protein [Gemmatimonadota bacterium]|nr:amidohydrolase family protein [Gemmatimonadota bacterium]